VREALFGALEARGTDFSRVLDVFAGSGALGIEALSRGAGACDFVESNLKAAAVIRENLEVTGFTGESAVHQLDVNRAVDRLAGPYSLVLADPPYENDQALTVLDQIACSDLLADHATLVLEHSSRRDAPERLGRLALDWSRRYGDTQISIYEEAES